MPELPEVESVRRGLEPHLVNARISRVRVVRPDYVHGPRRPVDLLGGRRVTHLSRLGKNLALHADSGGVVCLHLGMSGQVLLLRPREPLPTHAHVIWTLEDHARVVMRDPRRFGGVWTFADVAALQAHWRGLGPDALTCPWRRLHEAFARSRAPVKARLLDQAVVAGIGNIYADEALFRAGIDPRRAAGTLDEGACRRLATCVRAVLRAAVRRGGTTFSDFRLPDGQPGRYRTRHAVYGRGGEACRVCGGVLSSAVVAQRTTVWCPSCQPPSPGT